MKYQIDWTLSALNSHYEEVAFIRLKWNQKEVLKFSRK